MHAHKSSYLWLQKFAEVRFEVEYDSIDCARKSDPPDKQGEEHNVGENRCEISNLEREVKSGDKFLKA